MPELLKKAQKALEKNRKQVNDTFKPRYHLSVPAGWLNDPNGFIYYQGRYHLFYQFYPYDSVWGSMHWGHWSGESLVNWREEPVAMAPDKPFDEGGCYSGTSLEKDGILYLAYTGIVEKPGGKRLQQQCIAQSSDGVHFEKWPNNPVIKSTDLPPDASPYDFRDPKIERWGNGYRMTVASKSQKGGQLLGFYSEDLQNWRCLGVYADGLGGMAECPDIFALNGKQVVVVCLMDYEGGDMPNNNPVIYLTGKEIDGQFEREGGMRVMDWGLDFYAPQTMYTPDGRRVMISWAFRWGNVLPTHTLGHGWAGTMTLPRECVFEEGKLIQKPVKEIENRRASAAQREPFFVSHWIELPECAGTCREIHLQIDMKEAHAITIHLLETEAEYFSLNYDKHTEFLMADRSKCGYPLTLSSASDTQSVTKTPVSLKNGILDLRIFVDVSIVEIYVNGGENVMTYLAFPKGKAYGVSICAKGTAQILQLESFEMA